MVWGATCVRIAVACAHASPMVVRLWKKYAARRKVNTLPRVSGLFPEEFEEVDRLAMGEDVQQAQKLSVDATRGRHDGWEESQKSIGCRVCLAVLPHFAIGSVVEQRIGVSVAQLSVAVHVPPAVTRVVVYQCHVDDQIRCTCKIDVPNLQVALLSSAAGGDVFAARGETGALDNLF